MLESGGKALHRYKPSQDVPWHTIQVNILLPTILTLVVLAIIAGLVVFYSQNLYPVAIPLWVCLTIAVVFQAYAAYGYDHTTFDIQVLLSLLAMGFSAVALKVLRPTKPMLYGALLLLALLVMLCMAFAKEENGARLSIFGFMPGEVSKAAVPYIYLWSIPYLSGEKADKTYRLLFALTICILSGTLMIGCNDFGNGLINAAIGCAMLINHSPKAGIPVAALGLSLCPLVVMENDRLKTRVDMVWDVLDDVSNDAFWQMQTHQLGVISSGVLGRGVGTPASTRILYLAEADNDFSLLVLTGVFGLGIALVFIGMILTLALHAIFAKDGGVFAQQTRRVAVIPLMGAVYVSVGSQLAMLPFMGQNIPFLSSGGSSMLANALTVGLIMSTFLPNTVAKELRRFHRRNKRGVIQHE